MSAKIPLSPHSSLGHAAFIDETPATAAHTMLKNAQDAEKQEGNSMLSNHKGKLAVGAAAMLGLAVYYKWREHQLAKEDPEEYRRVRRITASVENGESPPGRKA